MPWGLTYVSMLDMVAPRRLGRGITTNGGAPVLKKVLVWGGRTVLTSTVRQTGGHPSKQQVVVIAPLITPWAKD